MRTINFRRISAATIAIAASAALTLGGAQSEAWGGKSTSWELNGGNSGKHSTSWEKNRSEAGKSTSWELNKKSTSWE